jgi:hypothetical protein
MPRRKSTRNTAAPTKEEDCGKRAQNTKTFPIDADDLLCRSAAFFGLSQDATDAAATLMRGSYAWRII